MNKDNLKDKFNVLGKLMWLWMNSPLHKEWPLQSSSEFLLKPIEYGQYLLIEREGMPVSYCSWAFVSDKEEENYIFDATSKIQDWQNGNNLWFIDWVAPFSKRDSFEMRSILKEKFKYQTANALRVKKHKKSAHIMEFKGHGLDKQVAKEVIKNKQQKFVNLFLKTQN